MKLYDFILKAMNNHLGNIAFKDINMTYKELIDLITKKKEKYRGIGKFYFVNNNQTKIEQTIEILAILASHNIAIPSSDINEDFKNIILNDKKKYNDLSFLIFTSGTTASKKAVMLTSKNIINNIKGIDNYFSIKESEKNILILRPLKHISALVGELLFSLYKGLTISFYENILHPNYIELAIKKNNISIIGLTPTLFEKLYKNNCQLITIKHVILSGEILSTSLAKEICQTYKHVTFYNAYGMSENSPRATIIKGKDFIDNPGSVGKPLLNTKIKIVNKEVLIKSKSIMKGYYQNKKLTKKKIIRGYYHTGDIGYFNENGFLFIVGRNDNMIIKAGVNINPEEIEQILKNNKGIIDCVAYKINSASYGIKLISNLQEKEIMAYLANNIPPIMFPSVVNIVDKIEYTDSMKVKR